MLYICRIKILFYYMKRVFQILCLLSVIVTASVMFSRSDGSGGHSDKKHSTILYSIHSNDTGAQTEAVKLFAILPAHFTITPSAVQNPNEGLSAYSWEKDKRNRVNMCRNNC